jgi:hypothetical protein
MMRYIAQTLLLIFLAIGCDAPTATRQFGEIKAQDGDGLVNKTTTSGATDGGNNGDDDDPIDDLDLGPGFENCNINPEFPYFNGAVSICLNSNHANLVSKEVKMMFSETDVINGSCIIFMKNQPDGGQKYVSNPSCVLHTADLLYGGTISTLPFYQNGTYVNETVVNGVMVMKPQALGAFQSCSDAADNYIISNCPVLGGNYTACMVSNGNYRCLNPTTGLYDPNNFCNNNAMAIQSSMCATFTNNFQYRYIPFFN